MDAIARLGRRARARARGRADDPAGLHRLAQVPRRVPATASPTASSRSATMTLYETAPLIHSADERIDVRDLGFAADFFTTCARRDLWLRPASASRCGSAAWRCATACSSTARRTGPPPSAPRDGAIGVASGAKPRLPAPSTASPACAAWSASARRWRSSRSSSARCPRRSCRSRTPRCSARWPARPLAGIAAAPPRCAAPAARRPRRRSRCCPRSSRCAAASSPPTTASSTRRSPPTSTATRTRADAAKEHDRCGSHLMAPMLAANLAGARCCSSASSSVRRPVHGAALSLASIGAGGRGLRLVRAPQRLAALRKPCAGRATSSSGVLGTREPDERQLEVGRAALAEILRVEGCSRARIGRY